MTLGEEILTGIINDFREDLAVVSGKLDRLLLLEERMVANKETMGRVWAEIEQLNKRMREAELAMPVTKERADRSTMDTDKSKDRWTTAIVSAVFSILIAAIIFLATKGLKS
jgi:hypothetical protein